MPTQTVANLQKMFSEIKPHTFPMISHTSNFTGWIFRLDN